MNGEIRYVFNGPDVFVRDDGVKFKLADVFFKETTVDMDSISVEYELTGPKGADTIAWLQLNFPRVRFFDPRRERVEAYAVFVKSIEDRAIERYKKEQERGRSK